MEGEHQVVGTALDYGIIIGYFVLILGFGSIFGRFTKSTKDFFFGGQRFAWWIVAFSLVATTVGSYSFIKYSHVAFTHGLASSMSYTNDWFWMPIFMFIWLPVIYFSRVTSVPEYFERRFSRKVRGLVTAIMLVYLVGYIGINFLTLGIALEAMLGWDLYFAAIVVAVISAIYVTAGGQTSVIMTDLVQGLLLLFAGFLLFGLGIAYLAPKGGFWANLVPAEMYRLPLNAFNDPPEFNFVGVLWQDGVAQSMFAYFINQGMIMRFLAVRSTREGRKAAIALLLGLQILAAVAVSNAGWIGRAMVTAGMLPADTDPKQVFVVVSNIICSPGVFGFVMAALTAALMSTADTLINAASAVAVNDIYRLYVRKTASDKHYLKVARWISILVAVIGIVMVPVYASFKSIYAAHGAFTAAISPPLAVALVFAILWKRFSAKAAFATILGGSVCIIASIVYPDLIAPFSHGVARGGEYFHAWAYQRALYGVFCSAVIGIVAGLIAKPADIKKIAGLVWGTLDEARRRYKGAEANHQRGERIVLAVERLSAAPMKAEEVEDDFHLRRPPVRLHPDDLERLRANEGDQIFLAHTNWLLGGLRGAHGKVGESGGKPGVVGVPEDLLVDADLEKVSMVKVELIL